MKALAWGLAVVLVAGLLTAELAMNVTPADRPQLYMVFGAAALVSFFGAAAALRVGGHLRSIRTGLTVVALAAVAITGLAVVLAALTMFIDPHDLKLLLTALVLGVGLGGVVAVAIAKPLTEHLAAVSVAARKVATGDLSARTGVERGDELGEVARAFDGMVTQLEAMQNERKTLLAAISHDLRSPLSSMQAAVEALQDGIAPDPPGYLRGLSNDIHYLGRLVDDLFVMARIDAGSYQLVLSPVDLAELADEAVEAVTPAAATRKVELAVAAPGRLGVTGDPAALGRVFRNLLANAVRHSPEGGKVRIHLARGPSHVTALVADEGNGFSPVIRSRAFEKFVRADDSRNRDSGGSGLGLAIAKGIVEAHGGEIEIVDGAGGQVRFRIPVSQSVKDKSAVLGSLAG